jgi:hypothetical protein
MIEAWIRVSYARVTLDVHREARPWRRLPVRVRVGREEGDEQEGVGVEGHVLRDLEVGVGVEGEDGGLRRDEEEQSELQHPGRVLCGWVQEEGQGACKEHEREHADHDEDVVRDGGEDGGEGKPGDDRAGEEGEGHRGQPAARAWRTGRRTTPPTGGSRRWRGRRGSPRG